MLRDSGCTAKFFFTILLLVVVVVAAAGGLAPGLALNLHETGWLRGLCDRARRRKLVVETSIGCGRLLHRRATVTYFTGTSKAGQPRCHCITTPTGAAGGVHAWALHQCRRRGNTPEVEPLTAERGEFKKCPPRLAA